MPTLHLYGNRQLATFRKTCLHEVTMANRSLRAITAILRRTTEEFTEGGYEAYVRWLRRTPSNSVSKPRKLELDAADWSDVHRRLGLAIHFLENAQSVARRARDAAIAASPATMIGSED